MNERNEREIILKCHFHHSVHFQYCFLSDRERTSCSGEFTGHLIPSTTALCRDMRHEQTWPSTVIIRLGSVALKNTPPTKHFQRRQSNSHTVLNPCFRSLQKLQAPGMVNLGPTTMRLDLSLSRGLVFTCQASRVSYSRKSWPRVWCRFNETSLPSAETCLRAFSNLSSTGVHSSLFAWNNSPRRSRLALTTGKEDSVAIVKQCWRYSVNW